MNSQTSKQNSNTSKGIYERAVEVIPGGVSRNTIFRKPHPHYVASASGSYIKDVDGTARLDFANNMASLIHGHSHPEIVNAVTEQLRKGSAYTMGSEAEVVFAELLTNRTAAFEKVRFVNSGTEAVMTMIKASRVYTGKPKIAKAEGAYHGSYDFAEISQTANPSNWGDINQPNSVPVVQSTPQSVMDNVLVFSYNDIERTINLLDQNADQLASVLIDPVPHRVGMFPASNDFIQAIFNWTRKNNVLLIFDEVITYRINYSGAQASYSAKPDLTALGKIIGGGFPIGAIAGEAEIMKVLDPTEKVLRHPHSGTFSANPVSMTAGRVAMELFDEQAVLKLNALAIIARNQIEESIKIANVPVSITGAGSMMRLHLQENAPTTYREINQTEEAKAIINNLVDYLFFEEDIITINTLAFMFATTHTQDHVDRLSEALLKGFKLVKGRIERLSS